MANVKTAKVPTIVTDCDKQGNFSTEDNTAGCNINDSTHTPYLPIRKKSSKSLRLDGSRGRYAATVSICKDQQVMPKARTTRNIKEVKTQTMHENIGKGQDSSTYTHSGQTKNLSPIPHPKIRPRANSGEFNRNRAKFLRTATSIPDYRIINAAYLRQTSAPLPLTSTASKNPNSGIPTFRPVLANGKDGGSHSMPDSLHSALTNASSAIDLTNTEKSSILTNRSSLSEQSNHQPTWPLIQADDMSVEDTIALYAEGFSDEPVHDKMPETFAKNFTSSPLAASSLGDTLHPRINGIGFAPPTALLKPLGQARASVSAQSDVGTSTMTIPSHDNTVTGVEDRLKALIGPPRDRYGFKKESRYITVAQYDAWNSSYNDYLLRRRKKWVTLMKQHKLPIDNPTRFPPKSDKVKRYIRKGIPPDWRGPAWFFYAGGPSRMDSHPDLYSKLVAKAAGGDLNDGDRDHIERDLFRTFPDHIKFKPDDIPHSKDLTGNTTTSRNSGVETPMILGLRRVLQAFAVHQPKIGYCQSLNFLAGYLLIFLSGDEERAFHLLCILTSEHLPGTHGISLEGANIDISVFMICLRDSMPSLWTDKIDDRADTTVQLAAGDMRVSTGLPTVSLATTGWFMSCFTSTLPVESTCRIWDCLFYEGSKTLFRVGLAIFKLCERDIRRTSDESMEVFQVIQTLPKGMLDANLVISTATKKSSGWSIGGASGFGGLSQKVIQKRREEKRDMYKMERERVLLKALTMPVDERPVQVNGEKNLGSPRKRRLPALRGTS